MRKFRILFILLLLISANEWSKAQTIALRIQDTTVVAGNMIDIPIYADNTLSGNNVTAYALQLTFDPYYFQQIAVVVDGTISASLSALAINTSIPGKITIANAGTTPLAGLGKFIIIRFKALRYGGTWIGFSGTTNNYFNEGTPDVTLNDGYISITSPPYITVYPNTGTITKGEQLQFNVSGGTAPFQWFVTNPGVATIDAAGWLTGTQPGFTKVVAQDKNGIRDTSGLVEIRAMRLSIPTTLSHLQGTDIDVPVNVTDLGGLNINSGNIKFSFNQNILTPIGIVQTGTLLASYPAPEFNISTPGVFSMAFAGSSSLTGSGILVYIRFHVSLQNSGATGLDFTSGLFNQDLLPTFTNGYFTVTNLPTLALSPNTGNLVAGETQQLSVNGGGIAPFLWSVSNTDAASISQTGLMSAKKSGIVKIMATDSNGATANSGNFQIYDTRITMPDTVTCPDSQAFYYPILVNALPAGESVFSIQGTVTYNTTYLTFVGIETVGTLTDGWSYAFNPSAGQFIFAGSGTSSFNSSGAILKLKFDVSPSFTKGTNAAVNLSKVTFNEGFPLPLVDTNGSIAGGNPPNAPGTISGTTTVIPGQNSVSYSVPILTNATSYIWTLPTGATGTSTSNSISVNYGSSAISGDITVKGHNSCGDGTLSTLAITVKSSLIQDIALNVGWNIISAYVVPANLDLKVLFQSLIDGGSLKKVMDEAGKTIENFGAFGGWKNNIGNLNSAKGYKVNVTAISTLSLEGTPVPLPMDIPLAAGWNIIAYPSATAQDAKALVQPLIDGGQLKKVMDEAGKTIENFGAFGGWKNNIGNFLPGRGYKVNVTAACTLTITAPANKLAIILPEVLASAHFTKVFTGNGTDHFNIHLVDLASSGLVAGDQIGIFDGTYCVGAATIGSDQLMSGNISIPASCNEEQAGVVNGFTVGHPVTLQLYRDNQTYPLSPAKVGGSEAFEKNGSLFLKVTASDLLATKINVGSDQMSCYPNPFSDHLTIVIRLTEPKNLEVKIYDLSGKLLRSLFKGEARTSETLVWDGTNGNGAKMISGTYILKVNEMIEKIVLKN